MPDIRVLIAEDNALQRDLYLAALEPHTDIHILHTAHNGADALQYMQHTPVDVVLFDLVMPMLDGFGLLERVSQLPAQERPAMMALTAMGRDDFIARAINLGADDYMIKPVDVSLLADRIRSIYQYRYAAGKVMQSAPAEPQVSEARHDQHAPAASGDAAKYASVLLMQLGIPAHLTGCRYLQEAVTAAVQSPDFINHMTAQLYPSVAAHCQTTASRVERSIRHAIGITWDRGGGTALNRILGRSTALPADKPSNSELIALLAARIRMKEGR